MPLDHALIRAILFDIDGTLSDTDDLWVSRLERTLAPLQGLLPGRQARPFARRVIMGLESPLNNLYAWLDRLDLDRTAYRLLHVLSRRSQPKRLASYQIIPGVAGLLSGLSARFPLAVVSARDADSSLAFLDHFELRQYFQVIATAQTCRYTKPFPDPVIWAASQLGMPPTQCLMVGDTPVDIRAGRSAGSQTLGVLCGFGVESELRRAGADEILPSTVDLERLLTERAVTPSLD